MKSYSALKAQIEKLEKQAEAIRKKEISAVVAELKRTIAEYGLSAADLGLNGGGRKSSARKSGRGRASVGVAKYRDPQTGETWTGRGRPPAWIVGAKDRDAFLIDADSGSPKRKAGAAGKSSAASGKSRGRRSAAAEAAVAA